MLTSLTDKETVEDCIELGASGFHPKRSAPMTKCAMSSKKPGKHYRESLQADLKCSSEEKYNLADMLKEIDDDILEQEKEMSARKKIFLRQTITELMIANLKQKKNKTT